MSDTKVSGRALLFEQLRQDTIAETQEAQVLKGERVKPLTPAQAEAFLQHAVGSLRQRA